MHCRHYLFSCAKKTKKSLNATAYAAAMESRAELKQITACRLFLSPSSVEAQYRLPPSAQLLSFCFTSKNCDSQLQQVGGFLERYYFVKIKGKTIL